MTCILSLAVVEFPVELRRELCCLLGVLGSIDIVPYGCLLGHFHTPADLAKHPWSSFWMSRHESQLYIKRCFGCLPDVSGLVSSKLDDWVSNSGDHLGLRHWPLTRNPSRSKADQTAENKVATRLPWFWSWGRRLRLRILGLTTSGQFFWRGSTQNDHACRGASYLGQD